MAIRCYCVSDAKRLPRHDAAARRNVHGLTAKFATRASPNVSCFRKKKRFEFLGALA
jgi:hypothetical protein